MSERVGSDTQRLWDRMMNFGIDSKSIEEMSFKFRVVPLYRIRLFPTLISKINWLESELPLNYHEKLPQNMMLDKRYKSNIRCRWNIAIVMIVEYQNLFILSIKIAEYRWMTWTNTSMISSFHQGPTSFFTIYAILIKIWTFDSLVRSTDPDFVARLIWTTSIVIQKEIVKSISAENVWCFLPVFASIIWLWVRLERWLNIINRCKLEINGLGQRRAKVVQI